MLVIWPVRIRTGVLAEDSNLLTDTPKNDLRFLDFDRHFYQRDVSETR